MPIMKLPSTYHSLAYEPVWSFMSNSARWKHLQHLNQGCAPSPLHCFHHCCTNLCKATTPTCPPRHTYTFSSSHTKPSTLQFHLVNLLARFPNRWQVSRMRQISISSPIFQNTRALEEACSQPRSEIMELREADGFSDPPNCHPPALRPGWGLPS